MTTVQRVAKAFREAIKIKNKSGGLFYKKDVKEVCKKNDVCFDYFFKVMRWEKGHLDKRGKRR